MKKISSILLLAFVLTSCGGGNENSISDVIASQDLEVIRTKKEEITNNQILLASQLKLLDDEIAKLDTIRKVPLITTLKAKEQKFDHYFRTSGKC